MKPVSGIPLYEEIARNLIAAIDDGTYPVGSLMPPEIDLAKRYEVSRQTMRMAMHRLTEIGAVSRRAGAGTRVEARQQAPGSFQWTLASLGDLTRLAAATRRDTRRCETVIMDRRMARDLGAPPGSRWVRLSYLRQPIAPRTEPLAWVDVYVGEHHGTILETLGDEPGLVCDLIERKYGLITSEVRQEVSVVELGAEEAEALAATPYMPALRVLRRYYDQRTNLFEISVSIHPMGRYTISSTLKRLA